MPNFRPFSLHLFMTGSSPPTSFFVLTFQSPKEVLSLSRRPNHPSSRTNVSIFSSFNPSIKPNSFFVSKSKNVASQLFATIGGTPRFKIYLSIARWKFLLMPPKPHSEYVMRTSGVTKLSFSRSLYRKSSGLIPPHTRMVPNSPVCALRKKLPL